MKRRSRLILLTVVFGLLVQSGTAFGSAHGADHREAAPGETVTFNTYLFGSETVRAVPHRPGPGWQVAVSPEQVDLSHPSEYPYRHMSIGGEMRKVVEVRIAVTPPVDASGEETVPVEFRTGGTATGSGLGVSQVQEFVGTVDVQAASPTPAPSSTAETEGGETTDNASDSASPAETTANASQAPAEESDSRAEPSSADSTRGTTGLISSSTAVVAFLLFEAIWIASLLYLRKRGW